ncbi:MAG: hypothetical protein IJS28_07570 [Synergistaceae bacterium]|nr:hypothetical protein [Synergistaceae bacterium]
MNTNIPGLAELQEQRAEEERRRRAEQQRALQSGQYVLMPQSMTNIPGLADAQARAYSIAHEAQPQDAEILSDGLPANVDRSRPIGFNIYGDIGYVDTQEKILSWKDRISRDGGVPPSLQRYMGNFGLGVTDTFIRGALNVPAQYILDPLGRASETLFGGESTLKSAAKQLFDWDAAYSKASTGTREVLNGTSGPTFADNVLHGSGTSLGHMLLGYGAGKIASLLGVVSPQALNFIRFLGENFSESLTEGGNAASDAYASDKSRYDDAIRTGWYSFLPNAGVSLGQSWLEAKLKTYLDTHIMPGTTEGIKWLGREWLKGAIKEEANELLEEPRQQAIEQAVKNTFDSGDMSWGNLFVNLLDEGRRILPYREKDGSINPGYFAQVAPETAASTLLTSLITAPLEISGGGRQQKRQNVDNRTRMEQLTKRRDTLQEELTNTQIAQAEHPNDVDLSSIIEGLTAEINGINQSIADVQDELDRETLNLYPSDDDATPSAGQDGAQDEQFIPPFDPDESNTAAAEQQDDLDGERYNQANKRKMGLRNSLSSFFDASLPLDDTRLIPPSTPERNTNTARIRTMRGTEADIRYRVVDADDLITSTNERGAPNSNYPQELQPRQRDREASFQQIERIANDIDPELLAESRLASNGAPVIGSDMVVESGNGRVMALRQAYRTGKAEGYRNWLNESAGRFGLTARDFAGIANPVLVRERTSDVDRVRFAREANESSTAAFSATENAQEDARRITTEMLRLYDPSRNLHANRQFLSAFIGSIPPNERGSLIQHDGIISRAGLERAQNAIAALAYGNNSILNRLGELFDDDIKNISNALIQAAPKIAMFENSGRKQELSLQKDIAEAVSSLVNAREQGKSVEAYLSQPNLFGDGISPEAETLLRFFDKNKRSAKTIAEGLQRYAELASREAGAGQTLMFDDSARDKGGILGEAINNTGRESYNQSAEDDTERTDITQTRATDKVRTLTVEHEGKKQTFTVHEGEFSDKQAKHKRLFGKYLEVRDSDGKSVARYSVSGDKFSAAPDTDASLAEAVESELRDKLGAMLRTGRSDTPHRHTAKPTEKKSFSDRLHDFVLGQEGDSRGFFQRTRDTISERKAFNHARKQIQEKIEKAFSDLVGGSKQNKQAIRYIAKLTSYVYAARLQASAHLGGMTINELADIWSLDFQFSNKTTNNRGTTDFQPAEFDKNGNLLHAPKTIVYLYEEANLSTMLHEAGHIFLHDMRRLVQIEGVPDSVLNDWATLTEWLGVSDIDLTRRTGELSQEEKARWKDAHEKFATAFEKYLMTNEAPTSKLRRAFEAFKRWLLDIYEHITNIQYMGSDGKMHSYHMSDEIRKVMDRMLQDVQYVPDTEAAKKSPYLTNEREIHRQGAESETQSWSDTIDRFMNGELSRRADGNLLHVMDTPDVFTLVGMERLPIEIHIGNIDKILRKKHHLSPETLKQIPKALADPVMIFKSQHDISKDRDSRVILTELREKDARGIERSVMAAITLGKANLSRGYAINELTTVYRKDTSSKQQLTPEEDIYNWITRTFKDGTPMNLLLYINKEKARQGAMSPGISPLVFDILNGLPNSIPDEHDLARLKSQSREPDIQQDSLSDTPEGFISKSDIERYDQRHYHATGHTVKDNRLSTDYAFTGGGWHSRGYGIYTSQLKSSATPYRTNSLSEADLAEHVYEFTLRDGRRVRNDNTSMNWTDGERTFGQDTPEGRFYSHIFKMLEQSGDRQDTATKMRAVIEGYINGLTREIENYRSILDGLKDKPDSPRMRIRRNSVEHNLRQAQEQLAYARDNAPVYADYIAPKKGNIYTAEGPEDYQLLDWDKPIHESPRGVRNILRSVIKNFDRVNMTGGELYRFLAKRFGSEKKASMWLMKQGIPGLMYLDAQSRQAGGNTHNYVVWDENMLHLLDVEGDRETVEYFRETRDTQKTPTRIGRTNDTLITPEEIERYDQIAYQGTPHIVHNGFNLKYIGTGEGSQVFGWGLYFAEERSTAETYRTNSKDELTIKMKDGSLWHGGNLYKVDLPDNDVLLDLDAELSEQPPKVQKALRKFIEWVKGRNLSDGALKRLQIAETGFAFYGALVDQVMPELMDKFKRQGGTLGRIDRADMAASLFLNRYGIPGLRFLDKFSRYDETGNYNTHNFVIWNTDLIKMLGISADSAPSAIDAFRKEYGGEVYQQSALGRQNSIRDVLDIMQTEQGRRNSGNVWADYARVSPEEARRISEATGLDISDRYVHTIIGSAVTHTLNRHGEGNEQRGDQLPITDEDFERIPYIIQNADEIRLGTDKTTGNLNDTIVYQKRINGHVLIVEEVRRGRKKLAFHTMRKARAGYVYDLSLEGQPIVRENAKSEGVNALNDTQPEAGLPNALSTGDSVQDGTAFVNGSGTESYQQLIGERAAFRLDNLENSQWRTRKLMLAERMESSGRSPRQIWAATGWARGADGEWRFELPYGKIRAKNIRRTSYLTRKADALYSKLDRNPNYIFTAEEQAFLDSLNAVDISLPQFFDAPVLFDAYPRLRNVAVVFSDLDGASGMYSSADDVIYIDYSVTDAQELRKTLVHEIQHAIQTYEGFNAGAGFDVDRDAAYRAAETEYEHAINSLDKASSDKVAATIDARIKGESKEFQELIRTLSPEQLNVYMEAYEARMKMRDRANALYDKYFRTAGEVEARNAEKRAYWRSERRARTSPDASEDVERGRQIVHRTPRLTLRTGESFNQIELKTEAGHSIEEAGLSERLLAPNGTKIFGVIDKRTAEAAGIPEGSIQLDVQGLLHTKLNKHNNEILNAGYPSVEAFFVDVLSGYDRIYQGSNDSLLLAKALVKHNGVAAIELIPDESGTYLVKTGWIVRDRGLKKTKLLFSRSEPSDTSPVAGEVLQTSSNTTGENAPNALLKSNVESLHSNPSSVNSGSTESYNQTARNEGDFTLTPEAQAQMDEVRRQYEGTSQWMRAPNGKPTKLTEQQWLAVRTPAFKAWFGDWEAAQIVQTVRYFLENSEPVASITGLEFQKDDTPLVDRVINYYRETGNTVVTNEELGDVVLDKRGIKDSSAHGLGQEKAAAFAVVPDVIRKGLIYDRQSNWKGRKYDTATLIANVKIGGEDYVCEVIVKRSTNRQGFYLHEVELKKNLDGVFKTVLNNGTPSRSRLIISKYAEKADSVSRIVDENGEPLVVYRGVNRFTSRSSGKLPGILKNAYSWERLPGAFFTSNIKSARTYTHTRQDHLAWDASANDEDYIYRVFLNIRNPYIFEGDGRKWDTLETHIVIADAKNNILESGFKDVEEARKFFAEHYIGAELQEAIDRIYEHEKELLASLDEEEISRRVEELRKDAEDEDEFDEDAAREEIEDEEVQKRLSPEERALLDKYSEIHRKYRVASYHRTTDEIVQEVAHGVRGVAPNGEEYDGIIFRNVDDVIDVNAHTVTQDKHELLSDVIVPLRHVDIKSATDNNGNFATTDPEIYHQSISNNEALHQAHSLAEQIADLDGSESYHQHYDSRALDELIKRNRRAEPAFRQLMDELHSELGGELITRKQMKTPERIVNKAYRVFGGDVSKVGDVWAATLIFDTEDELLNAIEALRRRRDVVHQANRWSRPKRSSGYRDFEAHLALPDGTVVELQLQHKGIQAVKDNVGHSLYEFMSNNDKWGELHDYIWQAGDISKRLYSAAMDGSYQALSAQDKDTLRALGENLADAEDAEQVAERIDALASFMDEVLPQKSRDTKLGEAYAEHHLVSPAQVEQYEQTMYHGTDNTIRGRRFDLRYAGSSEGSASIAYGAYMAELPAVAQQYRHFGDPSYGTPSITITTNDGHSYSSMGIGRWRGDAEGQLRLVLDDLYTQAMAEKNPDLERTKKDILKAYKQELREQKHELTLLKKRGGSETDIEARKRYVDNAKKKIDALENVTGLSIAPARKGNVYMFDGPENNELLDWDTHITKQPEAVRTARREILQELKRMGLDVSELKKAKTGREFYEALTRLAEAYPVEGISDPKQKASLILNEHGVLGTRYLDSYSGDGISDNPTHNFVIWDTDRLKMLGVEGNPEAEQEFRESNTAESYNQIGVKRKGQMDSELALRRPDMTPEQRADAISEIEKLGETVRRGGNPKVEKIAHTWLLKGHIILPEDNYKILDAIKICEQQHLDPMSFDDPNEILAKYTIKETKASRRIHPDTVPEFSSPVAYEDRITVYTVDDTEAGQQAVRRIIDTHWGEDANPWCLAARQDGSMEAAWEYWNSYDSVEKRIAFKDGKLLAFCASDDDNITWWDREDVPHHGIPYNVKTQDGTVTYTYDEEIGKKQKAREELYDGTVHDWYEDGTLKTEALPDGTEHHYYKDGSLMYERLPDGTEREWYPNGSLSREVLPDETEHTWHQNGKLSGEFLPDGTTRMWYQNGNLQNERLSDGTTYSWHEDGQLGSVELPNGKKYAWYPNGQLLAARVAEGIEYLWQPNGQKVLTRMPSGTILNIYENEQQVLVLKQVKQQAAAVKVEIEQRYSGRGEQYHQILGEQGARRLDELDGSTMRMDNLATAKDMEQAGKDAKTIRLATGWEKAPDGKWRYEILDADFDVVKAFDDLEAFWAKRKADLSEREKALLDEYATLEGMIPTRLTSRYSDEQKAKFREMRRYRDKVYREYEAVSRQILNLRKPKIKLFEVLGDEHELLKAYPELRWLFVSFKNINDRIGGYYSETEGIVISSRYRNDRDFTRSILIHEVQHAIQHIEGFAGGGNQETFAPVFSRRNELIARRDRLDDVSGLNNLRSLLRDDILNGKISIEEAEQKFYDARKNNDYADEYAAIAEELEQIDTQLDKDFFGARNPADIYWHLGGEIEARNAQKRSHMTAEERRNTPLNETEDAEGWLINPSTDTITAYQMSEHYHQQAEEWNIRINSVLRGKTPPEVNWKVVDTPPVLQLAGAPNLPIYMKSEKIVKIVHDHRSINHKILKQIPRALADPVAVFSSETQPGSIIIMTDILDELGANVVIPVRLNYRLNGYTVNKISTVYAKRTVLGVRRRKAPQNSWFINQVKAGRLLYLNTSKAAAWNERTGLNLATPEGSTVRTERDLDGFTPATASKLITPERIEQYNQLVLHATGNIIYGNRFDLKYIGSSEGGMAYGFGAYFAQNRDVSETYRRYGLKNMGFDRITVSLSNGTVLSIEDIYDELDAIRKGTRTIKLPAGVSQTSFADAILELVSARINNHNNWDFNRVMKDKIEELKSIVKNAKPEGDYARRGREIIKALRKIDGIEFFGEKRGNIYQFDIPEDYELLNLDADLSEQPDSVQRSISEMLKYLSRLGFSKKKLASLNFWYKGGRLKTGHDLMRVVSIAMDEYLKKHPKPKDGITNAEQRTSMLFLKFGIPGHRYFDLESRGTDKSTYNYVIWDESKIRMVGIDPTSDKAAIDYYNRTKQLKEALEAANSETYNQSSMKADDFTLTPEAQRQMDELRRKYHGTAQWLKAPNGKKSNLTEHQWLAVRTPNFKQWFGDWENAPEHASKVLDENGEPLVVYHGTRNGGFSVFDTAPDSSHLHTHDTGAWFTSSREGAAYYAPLNSQDDEEIYPVFLNIRNPYIHEAYGADWDELADVQIKDAEGWPIYIGDADYHIGSEDSAWDYINAYLLRDEMDNPLENEDEDGNPIYTVETNGLETTDDIVRAVWNGQIGDGNHDGVIIRDVVDPDEAIDVYVTRTPEHIKSAVRNNGEYSLAAPEIYHQSSSFLQPSQLERYEQLMYHGTKNILEGNRFNLRYLGSGEGAQAFGYGIYLGQAEGTGEHYRKAGLSELELDDTVFIDKEGHEAAPDDIARRLSAASRTLPEFLREQFNHYSLIFALRDLAHGKNSELYSNPEEALDFVISRMYQATEKDEKRSHAGRTFKEKMANGGEKLLRDAITPLLPADVKPKVKRKGSVYLVDGPEDFELLDWDAPMTQQPKQVLDALKRSRLYLSDAETGEQLYRRLSKENGDGKDGDRIAAMKLNDAGVPGHRFWDEWSRVQKSGTHNFVIWNTDTLRLLGLSEDSEQDAQDYYRAEDYYSGYLDSLDNDSDVQDYSGSDYEQELDSYAEAQRDAQEDDGFSETYHQTAMDDKLPTIPEQQIEQVRRQYEGTTLWLKAPNGKDTALTERQWLLVRTPNFIRWFGDWLNDPQNASKVLDENGEPKVVYHGTGRADRVGSIFRADRATSGPMAFFTDSLEMAEGYARNKKDTSLSREEAQDYHKQFYVELKYPGSRKTEKVYLDEYWYYLTPEERAKIARLAPTIGHDNNHQIASIPNNTTGTGGYEMNLRKAKGNHFKALIFEWLDSANLFNREAEFLKVLALAGVENVKYSDPNYREEAVYSVFMNIRKPFLTTDISDELFAKLEKAARRAHSRFNPDEAYYSDNWDKTTIDPAEWIERLREDVEDGTTYSWTQIPDFVTNLLKKEGYDGIQDLGGKYHDGKHSVYIPFKSTQIKSADKNNGGFNLRNPDIYHQPILERFSTDNTEQQYRKGLDGNKKDGAIRSIAGAFSDFLHGFRGDFPDIAEAIKRKPRLMFAREVLRHMNRASDAKMLIAVRDMAKSFEGLDAQQLDIFSRYMLLHDIHSFWKQNPNAPLPLGFTLKSFRADGQRFTALVKGDAAIQRAVQAERKLHEQIISRLAALANELGMPKFAKKVRRNEFYVLDYARLLKGEGINSNYLEAVAETRTQQLKDIERMQALLNLRNAYGKKLKAALEAKFGNKWREHIPEGYKIFNPLQGSFIQSAHTLTDNLLGVSLELAGRQLGLSEDTMKALHSKVSDNSGSHLLVLPEALVDTLERLSVPVHRGPLGKIAKRLTTGWKKLMLFFPTHAFKYNLRNVTGDLDAALAGNPKAMAYLPKAVSELWSLYYGDGEASPELRAFQRLGGAVTIQGIQDLKDDRQLKEFNKLIEELKGKDTSDWAKLPRKAWAILDTVGWSGIQKFSDFREQWLRYACYLSYLNQMQSNDEHLPENWGASVREEVLSIPAKTLEGMRRRAFKMSNELLGAYDQVTESGQGLRDIAIPFYSWMEVNAKRYLQLIKNGITEDGLGDFASRFLKGQLANAPYYAFKLSKTYLMINLLSLLIAAFNHIAWPEDEGKLPPDIQERPHITLGHDSKSNVLYFDRVGAMLDNMEWFGQASPFAPFVKEVRDIFDGKMTVTQFIGQTILGVVKGFTNKIAGGINPLIKTPFELLGGKSLYPDVTNPRNINDRWQYIAQSFGLNWPYKLATGQPVNNWREFKNLFVYSADADEAAYFYTLGLVRKFQEDVLGKKTGGFAITQRGQALRRLKTALRMEDEDAVKRSLEEYYKLGGNAKGLKASMKNMNPLHGLNKQEQEQFLKWLSTEDRKYYQRAEKFFHAMADRYLNEPAQKPKKKSSTKPKQPKQPSPKQTQKIMQPFLKQLYGR